MVEDEERVIRPPIEHITKGRVFQPTNAFIGKKLLKVAIVVTLVWVIIFLLFLGLEDNKIGPIMLIVYEPLELLLLLGWELTNLLFWGGVGVIFLFGTIYVIVYVKRIEYSVLGSSGDALPEIYTKRGIITITKRHVPFRTVTNVETRRGIFDRIMGIGTILIETAGGSVGHQPTGVLALLVMRAGVGNRSEERIEGIRFHEELRDYILREMRLIGSKPSRKEEGKMSTGRKHIFTRKTLEAFKDVRDALQASRNEQ